MCRSREFANLVANARKSFVMCDDKHNLSDNDCSVYVIGEAHLGIPQLRAPITGTNSVARGKCPLRILLTVCLGLLCTFLTYLHLPESSDDVHLIGPRGRLQRSGRHAHPLNKRSTGVVNSSSSSFSFWEVVSSDVRLSQYCNTPQQVLQGQEGNIRSERYDLLQVHAVIVPGQRPISQPTPELPNPLYRCMLSDHSLKFSEIRNFMDAAIGYKESQHNKGAFKTFNIFPSKAFCGTEHLLPDGILQHILLGKNLKHAYRGKFETAVLRGANSLKVHLLSHHVEASYQSAMAFSHGFMESPQFHDVFIHKSHDNFCQSILINGTCSCLKNEMLRPYINRGKKMGHFMFKPGHPSSHHIAEQLGMEDLRSASILEISQNLLLRACQGIELQCRGGENCLDKSLIGQLLIESDSYWHSLTKDPIFVSYSKLYSYPFLKKLVMKMREHEAGQTDDMFVYSADSYLPSHILASLGSAVTKIPSYASRLVFELYSKENRLGPASRFIRLLHDGIDVTGHLQMCRDKLVDGLCKFKFFKDYLDLDLLEGKSYKEACSS